MDSPADPAADFAADSGKARVPCVGAVVLDAGRLLLVRRANEPAAGTWSLPGGRVEPGEEPTAAVLREVAEETGLRVVITGLIGSVELSAGPGVVYAVDDFSCRALGGGVLGAGDDATDVGWFGPREVAALPCSPGLVQSLREWGVLPAD